MAMERMNNFPPPTKPTPDNMKQLEYVLKPFQFQSSLNEYKGMNIKVVIPQLIVC